MSETGTTSSPTTPRNRQDLFPNNSEPGFNRDRVIQEADGRATDPLPEGRWSRVTGKAAKYLRVDKVEDEDDGEKEVWNSRMESFLSKQKFSGLRRSDQTDGLHTKVNLIAERPSAMGSVRDAMSSWSWTRSKNRRQSGKEDGGGDANESNIPLQSKSYNGKGVGNGRTEVVAVRYVPCRTSVEVDGAFHRQSAAAANDQTDFITRPEIEDVTLPVRKKDLVKFTQHRQLFTWFAIVSQTLIMAIALLTYGFGPWGLTSQTYSRKVVVPSLSLQEVEYSEPANIWGGPPVAALVRLGAKFSPCMRRDRLVYEKIEHEREEEKRSACCIRNDESGCVQTTEERCSKLLSTFHKWDNQSHPGPEVRIQIGPNQYRTAQRTSGAVCGQDPRYCESPASAPPNEWADDISKWPVCTKPNRPRLSEPHMSCEIIGRPCCIGIQGQCHITTQEYCEHVKGHFHEDATLCSQVSCMKDVCGLVSFLEEDHPDQFYRAFLSIFLHAGLLHLASSLTFYFFFMFDMERLIGPVRLAIIYIGSGIGGNLAAAAIVPYRAEVGPAGSVLGVMAANITVILYNWEHLTHPHRVLTVKLSITSLFFLMGLLFPWIDNYAHAAGFLVGMSLSAILIPYIGMRKFDASLKRRKLIMMLSGSLVVLILTVCLCVLVWVSPLYDCEFCKNLKYFNCLVSLFDDSLCPDQDLKVTRVDIL